VYFRVLSAVKRLLLDEIRDAFSRHPRYEKLLPFIQGQFGFDEKPEMGIVLTNSGSSPFKVSADNFRGTILSYSTLAGVPGLPGTSVEWVKDDLQAIKDNGDVYPSPPGIYILGIEASTFSVSPYLTVNDEVLLVSSGAPGETAVLANAPLVSGSLRLVLGGKIQMVQGEEYSFDASTGLVTFLRTLGAGQVVTADYAYPGATAYGIPWRENETQTTAIPGCVLAFGRRVQAGDQMAVVLTQHRTTTHHAYGGKWNLSYAVDVLARDIIQFEEIVDYLMLDLWGPRRDRLSYIGIEITELSFSGEAEDVHDETTDDYYFTGSLTLEVMSDWEVHVPLLPGIRGFTTVSTADLAAFAGSDDDDLAAFASTLRAVSALNLLFMPDPVMVGRNHTYEPVR